MRLLKQETSGELKNTKNSFVTIETVVHIESCTQHGLGFVYKIFRISGFKW
jgi:hypothetical protein